MRSRSRSRSRRDGARRIAIVGSGFAGLGMAVRLKEAGIHDFTVLERADEVGGTWRDNTYPNCGCDVPSHVMGALRAMDARGAGTAEVRPEALTAYNQLIQSRTAGSVWTSGGCRSWYLHADGRNRILWPGFSWRFRRQTRRFDPAEYVLEPDAVTS